MRQLKINLKMKQFLFLKNKVMVVFLKNFSKKVVIKEEMMLLLNPLFN